MYDTRLAGLAGRAGSTKRHYGADSKRAVEAAQDLTAALIQRDIERRLAAAPPLTDEQAERLADLLRGDRS
ncbi:hypothetical protein ACTU6V_12745 [Microbacterium sp. A204]|uniref:hypothetical protein n=1 Tax=Microbacterium sp. A204 TaxID=3457321 RepID=UPI003FD2DFF9